MEQDLKKQTTHSLIWNAFDKVGFQVVAFVVGLVTLRLLSPRDFGLIGALSIFTALSNLMTESGFTSTMVRRKQNTDAEYVAVLCFNLFLSLVLYFSLFLFSGKIADYYNMPELVSLSHFLFLSIVFNSLGVVQTIILTKALSFEKLSLASLISASVSGAVAIAMIFLGYGYWALAWQLVLQTFIKVGMLWFFSDWRPRVKPDFSVIRELFSFSFSLIAASLMNTFFRYIYNPYIGRHFGDERLGYYSEAYKFNYLPVSIVASTFSGVALPVLSKLNDDEPRQMNYLRKMMRMMAFCVFPILFGAIACFDNLVEIVLTDKWLPIVPYFRIMALAGFAASMHTMYLNVMVVKGFPKLNFLLETVRNVSILFFFVLALVLIKYGPSMPVVQNLLFLFPDSVELMLWGGVAANICFYVVDLFCVRRVVRYSIREQIKDICPYLLISMVMASAVYYCGCLPIGVVPKTIIQLVCGGVVYWLLCKLFASDVLDDVSEMLLKRK